MTDPQEIFDRLSAPFMPEEIDWRVGSTNGDKTKGMALAYMDARAVMDRLDNSCGPQNWQCQYTQAGSIMICAIGVCFDGSWVWKQDGAGATDFEGEKGAMSDAFKRAAVRWGVGRYLYDIKAPWVAIQQFGKSFKIVEDERKKLDELYEKEIQRIGWGGPADVAVYKLLNAYVLDTITQPSDAERYRAKYGGMISQLRVKMRQHHNNQLDRIGGPQQQAAE
jgi:hypothetical protein